MLVLLEIRITIDRGIEIIKRLGFDNWELMLGDGYSRGIWIGWKSQKVVIEMVHENYQYMHMKIKANNGSDWFFTAIYANLASEMKTMLWGDLRRLSDQVIGAWLAAGDLNDIIDISEKKGGAPFNWS